MRLPRLTAVLLILAAAGLPAPAGAAEGGLTLEQARTRAIERSLALQKALLSVDSAVQAQKVRLHDLLPVLSVSAGASVAYPTQPTEIAGSASVAASQTIFDGGRYRILAAIDALDSEAAREKARAAWLTAVEDADSAYYAVLQAAASVEAARSDLAASALHEELARVRLEIGTITRSAYLKTESEKASKETALGQAQKSLSVAAGKLASLTGLTAPLELAGVDPKATETLAARVAALSDGATADLLARLSQAASSRGAAIAAAVLAADKSARQASLAARDGWPTVSASWSHGLGLTEATGLDDKGGSVTLSVKLPLSPWTTKAAVDSANLEARQAGLDLADTRESVALAIEGALYDGIASARALASSNKALEYAQSAYEGALEQYRLSTASSSDLSDAQALVSTSRASLISARYGFLTTLASLRTLAGLDSDDLLTGMIP